MPEPLAKPNAKGAKDQRSRANAKRHRAVIATVRDRDGGFCRVCGLHDYYGDPHHIKYLSLGGEDVASNIVWVCRNCHRLEHQHRIRISGTAEDLHVASPQGDGHP